MNSGIDYDIYDTTNLNVKTIISDKLKSNRNIRKQIQKSGLDILSHSEPGSEMRHYKTNNAPFLYKSVHDTMHPSNGEIFSSLKIKLIEKEKFLSKLIAPAININKRF